MAARFNFLLIRYFQVSCDSQLFNIAVAGKLSSTMCRLQPAVI
jgi:hypothetical protein